MSTTENVRVKTKKKTTKKKTPETDETRIAARLVIRSLPDGVYGHVETLPGIVLHRSFSSSKALLKQELFEWEKQSRYQIVETVETNLVM